MRDSSNPREGTQRRWVVGAVGGLVALCLVVPTQLWWSGHGTEQGIAVERPSAARTADLPATERARSRAALAGATPSPTVDADQAKALERGLRRYRASQRRLAKRVDGLVERRTTLPFTFRVATFNVLGDSHTGPGGNRPEFPNASRRMDLAISALRARDISVVGLQELETSQHHMLTARAGEYATYPGLSAGPKSVRFNIAWRTSTWTLSEAHTLGIPYAGGSEIQMPVVLLESVATGRQAWFGNFHNPADTPRLGGNARWRAIGSSRQVAHLTGLHDTTGHPVFSLGDYNDRAGIFCKFTAGGAFAAAAGGSNDGACRPPARMQVDWIFGSSDVSFADYFISDVGQASDHAMVHAQATLSPGELGGQDQQSP